MRTWAKGTAPAALLALGVMSLGSGTAFADTDGDHSVLGGNQVKAPITLPVDISGNGVGVAGEAAGSSQGGASVEDSGGASGVPGKTSGTSSVGGGNQVVAPITAPINACGNAVAVLGGSRAGCKGGSSVTRSGRGGGGSGGNRTTGAHSVLGGNQVVAPITAPINACGNAVSIFGDAVAGCKGGSSVTGAGGGRGAGGNTTSGRSSVLGGNQVVAPITAPINVCGNSAAVFGKALSGCKGGVGVPGENGPGRPGRPGKPGYPGGHSGGHPGGHGSRPGPQQGAGGNGTDGRFSVGGGNQVIAPITAPINLCGNSVGNGEAGCKGGSSVEAGRPGRGGGRGVGGNTTSGRSSVLGGNQVLIPITAPINVCGNAVAVLGDAFAGCRGGASIKGGGHGGGRGVGGNTTSGRSSVLGGNQVLIPITAPINACGNAVAALGDAAAGCLGGSHVGGGQGRLRNAAQAAGQGQWNGVPAKHRTSGLLSTLPVVPGLNPTKSVAGLAQQAGASGTSSLPVADEARDAAGLPELPEVPGVADPAAVADSAGVSDAAGVSGLPGAATRSAQSSPKKGDSPLAPTAGLVPSTPIGNALPVGLMSAAQPIGVTGMNSGSLLALVLGAMSAASATLFVTARRIRFARK
ncbi:chaplin family protein [Streptosporangium carneum]|uniref:Chaplin domain-containing protein n=1 Tax=Streptosporangium carneum TaxID=47481 RepID=A0A9W6MAH5_9ACTN|nr:chaplin family protein [Streptosporangium carneum]GLK06730.1 hypothetical protein GCM10017600_01350 [Streptosporangium carneum]